MGNINYVGSVVNNMIMNKIKKVEEPNIPSKIGSMTTDDKVPVANKDFGVNDLSINKYGK